MMDIEGDCEANSASLEPAPGKKDHWDCAMLAERMKSSKARTGAQGALCCRLIYR